MGGSFVKRCSCDNVFLYLWVRSGKDGWDMKSMNLPLSLIIFNVVVYFVVDSLFGPERLRDNIADGICLILSFLIGAYVYNAVNPEVKD